MSVWSDKIQWRNDRFEAYPVGIKARYEIPELRATIKIENLVAVKIPDGTSRLVYPYFSEVPSLPTEGARLGLWMLQEALKDFRPEDFRILDILRRAYFRPREVLVEGNERELLIQKYDEVLNEWRKLRDEP